MSELEPDKTFEIEPENFPFWFGNDMLDVEVIQKDPYKCAVLTKGEYGLLTFPHRAKKPRCILPCKNSKNCHHCMLWANNEGTHKVENNERPSVNRKRPETEFYRSMPGKMKWPPHFIVDCAA